MPADRITSRQALDGFQHRQNISRRSLNQAIVGPFPRESSAATKHLQTPQFESGCVLLPIRAPWLDEYRQELIAFPGSKHNDQVDSTTQALDYLSQAMRKIRIYDLL